MRMNCATLLPLAALVLLHCAAVAVGVGSVPHPHNACRSTFKDAYVCTGNNWRSHLPVSTKELRLSGALIKSLSPADFKGFVQLQNLVFDNIAVHTFHASLLRNVPTLKKLVFVDIMGNLNLHRGFFKPLVNLADFKCFASDLPAKSIEMIASLGTNIVKEKNFSPHLWVKVAAALPHGQTKPVAVEGAASKPAAAAIVEPAASKPNAPPATNPKSSKHMPNKMSTKTPSKKTMPRGVCKGKGKHIFVCKGNNWRSEVSNSAKYLRLSGKHITHLSPADFKGFTHLYTLVLDDISVKSFTASFASSVPTLRRIMFYGRTRDITFEPTFFEHLVKLSLLKCFVHGVSAKSIATIARLRTRVVSRKNFSPHLWKRIVAARKAEHELDVLEAHARKTAHRPTQKKEAAEVPKVAVATNAKTKVSHTPKSDQPLPSQSEGSGVGKKTPKLEQDDADVVAVREKGTQNAKDQDNDYNSVVFASVVKPEPRGVHVHANDGADKSNTKHHPAHKPETIEGDETMPAATESKHFSNTLNSGDSLSPVYSGSESAAESKSGKSLSSVSSESESDAESADESETHKPAITVQYEGEDSDTEESEGDGDGNSEEAVSAYSYTDYDSEESDTEESEGDGDGNSAKPATEKNEEEGPDVGTGTEQEILFASSPKATETDDDDDDDNEELEAGNSPATQTSERESDSEKKSDSSVKSKSGWSDSGSKKLSSVESKVTASGSGSKTAKSEVPVQSKAAGSEDKDVSGGGKEAKPAANSKTEEGAGVGSTKKEEDAPGASHLGQDFADNGEDEGADLISSKHVYSNDDGDNGDDHDDAKNKAVDMHKHASELLKGIVNALPTLDRGANLSTTSQKQTAAVPSNQGKTQSSKKDEGLGTGVAPDRKKRTTIWIAVGISTVVLLAVVVLVVVMRVRRLERSGYRIQEQKL